jgi:hypothetical protein
MRLLIINLFIYLTILSACGPNYEKEATSLYQEVMALHDEVMPKMSDINKAKKKLNELKDDENGVVMDAQIEALVQADDAMMNWMYQFKNPESNDFKANIEYLKIQKEKMVEVKTIMLKTIDDANLLIQQFEK